MDAQRRVHGTDWLASFGGIDSECLSLGNFARLGMS